MKKQYHLSFVANEVATVQPTQVRLSPCVVNNALIRNETLDGQDYWVLPVILITEGVHNGLLYSSEELSVFPEAWNGEPLPISHPVTPGGEFLSANSPEIEEKQNVGKLYNVEFTLNKLKGEAWINVEKARRICPELLQRIRAQERIEVSTGLLVELEDTTGNWQGEDYWGIVHNIRPDHLAILLDQKGACSWEDGAGLGRMNHKDSNMEKGKIRSAINSLAKALGIDLETETPEQGKEDEGTDLKGTTNVDSEKEPDTKEDQGEENVEKSKLINALIQNESTHWTEADKSVLEGLEEDVLQKMLPVENEEEKPKPEEKAPEEKAPEGVQNSKDDTATMFATLQASIENLKTEIPNLVQAELTNKDIEPVIQALVANDACDIPESVLRAMPADSVRSLANMVNPTADYSGKGMPRPVQNDSQKWDGAMLKLEDLDKDRKQA